MLKTIQEQFRREKLIQINGNKLYVKWKGYDNSFKSWIDKKDSCMKMSQYFPKPFKSFGENVSAKVDLSNYTTKTDLKKYNAR